MYCLSGRNSRVNQYELNYVRKGLAIFPLKANSKTPMTEHGCKDATRDPDTYSRLCGDRPHNVAIATGAISNIWVLDLDSDKDGIDTIRELQRQHGRLPETWTAQTRDGGYHLYWRWDADRPVASRVGVLPGLDTRGDGGYVVAPPSYVPSDSGGSGQYRWIRPPWRVPLASAPQWLYSALQQSSQASKDLSHLIHGAREGERNVSITQLIGCLLGRGVDPLLAWQLVTAYNQVHVSPPLPLGELERTFMSIASRESRKRSGVS